MQFPFPTIDLLGPRLATGYSRFPVHAPGEPLTFMGLLLVKKVRPLSMFLESSIADILPNAKLLSYDLSKGLPISSYALSILPEAGPNIDCFQALNYLYVSRVVLSPLRAFLYGFLEQSDRPFPFTTHK